MRDSLIQRASVRAVAAAWSTLVVIGCGGGETEPPGGGPPAPRKSVTSCAVNNDVTLGAGKSTSPAIASHGGRFAIAWSDEGRDGGDIMLTMVDENGRVDRTVALSKDKEKSVSPAITATADGYLVVWHDVSGGGGSVRGVRVDKDGAPQGAPYTLSESTGPEAHPNVVNTNVGTLAAWTGANEAVIAMAAPGVARGHGTMPAGAQIALAGGDDHAGAVWVSGSKLAFSKITVPPAPRTAEPTLFRNATGKANLPRIAAGPDDSYGVVWEDTRAGTDKEGVYFARIDDRGRVGREMEISPTSGSANTPDVTWIGDRAAVTYYQYRDGPSAIYLRLVDPEKGAVGNDLRVSTAKGARFPRVAWGGGNKLGVTYAERSGPAHLAVLSCQ